VRPQPVSGWSKVRIANVSLSAVLVLVGLLHPGGRSLSGEGLPADSWSLTSSTDPSTGWPAPAAEEADAPLSTPVPAPEGGGTHAFLQTQDDGVTPVAYDPCRPIHYVVRPEHEPAGGRALVIAAVGEVSALTGLQFVYDGVTTEPPSQDRPSYQPDRYGDRWAPVLITWATGAEVPDFAGNIAGLARSRAYALDDSLSVYVTGAVELDADWFSTALADPDQRAAARGVVLHELGHLVGLAHVDDESQVMAPGSGVPDFAVGDLTGLAQLGQGECAPDL
jgi:hypothetical protein